MKGKLSKQEKNVHHPETAALRNSFAKDPWGPHKAQNSPKVLLIVYDGWQEVG